MEKIGRNDPCSCNSGKKYKQCCLPRELARAHPPAPTAVPVPTPNPAQLSELATLFAAGRFSDMEEKALALINQFPESGVAWKALGTVFQVQGKDAVAPLRKAAKLLPNDSETFNNLAAALLNQGLAADAEAAARKALSIRPDFAEAHANLAKAAMLQERLEEAVSHYELAVKFRPDATGMQCSLGIAYNEQGRFEAATAAFETAIALDPAMIEAHYGRAQLVTAKPGEPYLAQLEQQIARAGNMPPEIAIRMWFALGKINEDLGQYDQAFTAYREGNRLKHDPYAVNDAGEDAMAARIMAAFNAEFMTSHAAAGYRGKTPVFIVGMPRSGSTLLEQILASTPGVHGAGELSELSKVVEETFRSSPAKPFPSTLPDLPPEAFTRMGQQYASRVTRLAPEAKIITDKMPANFNHLGIIKLILPHAKIIHIQRDAMDTCFSCYARLFAGDKQAFSYDLESLGHYYRRYEALMQHWHAVLPEGSILDVRYEDLVNNTEAEARRVLDYLDLPWDERCLDFHRNTRRVATASAAQVRRPVYQSSVARWKHFEKHLVPLASLVKQ